jgi:hypothetical protein
MRKIEERIAGPPSVGKSGSLGCIDLPTLTRGYSWIFRCKPLISNDQILAQLGKFT